MASPRIRSTSPVCWTRHTVLGGMAGVIGVGLLGFVVTTGLRGNPAEVAVVGALCFGIVAAVLLGLAQILERLLEM